MVMSAGSGSKIARPGGSIRGEGKVRAERRVAALQEWRRWGGCGSEGAGARGCACRLPEEEEGRLEVGEASDRRVPPDGGKKKRGRGNLQWGFLC
jgi:hypothetical protein